MYTLVCKDTLTGIFSGIYEIWAGKYPKDEVFLRAGEIENYELFMEYIEVPENEETACKVSRTIKNKFGETVYEFLCFAMWSDGEDKANAVYLTIRYGLEHRLGTRLLDHQTRPFINRVFELRRSVWYEVHHYYGFVRFAQLEEGVLHAEIEPRHYVLEPLAEHFADRFPMENWMISDLKRGLTVLHQASKPWVLVHSTQIEKRISESEKYYRELWKEFCSKISIESRENLKLQKQNLLLRFRGCMVEFK